MPSLIQMPVSGCFNFEDPDAFSAAIPGGQFGVLPLDRTPFKAAIRSAVVAPDLHIRSVRASGAVSIRSEFIGTRPTLTVMIPMLANRPGLLDGQEFADDALAIRVAGATPSLRTVVDYEIAAYTIDQGTLQDAAEAFAGKLSPHVFNVPITVSKASIPHMARMRQLQQAAQALLAPLRPQGLLPPNSDALHLIRDELLATVVHVLSGRQIKPDHRARQLQTRSMARIERYLDDHRETVTGLQELCAGTNLSIRTVESIVLSRTGISALTYLRLRRLAFVRRELLHPSGNVSVTSAATRFGFWHLGRFSQFYRQVYGELPSQTLARAQGRTT